MTYKKPIPKRPKKRYITRAMEFKLKRLIQYMSKAEYKEAEDCLAWIEDELIDMGLLKYVE